MPTLVTDILTTLAGLERRPAPTRHARGARGRRRRAARGRSASTPSCAAASCSAAPPGPRRVRRGRAAFRRGHRPRRRGRAAVDAVRLRGPLACWSAQVSSPVEWDAALALADVSRQAPAADLPARCSTPSGCTSRRPAATDVGGRLARAARPLGPEGADRHPRRRAASWSRRATRRRRRRAGAYDDARRTCSSRLWQPVFQARIRLAARRSASSAPLRPRQRRPSGRDARRRDRPAARRRPRRCSTVHRRVRLDWGPEGQAWVAAARRRDAALALARREIDPPAEDVLVEAWRETEQRFAEFGHVYELARGPRPAGRHPARHRRPRRRPRGRRPGARRPPTRWARSPSSTS